MVGHMTQGQLEQQALASAQRIFPCELDLLDKIPISRITKALVDNIVPQDKPFMVRVAGQSGSGKSSQLIPALEDVLQNQEYVTIKVGTFAPFHPQ